MFRRVGFRVLLVIMCLALQYCGEVRGQHSAENVRTSSQACEDLKKECLDVNIWCKEAGIVQIKKKDETGANEDTSAETNARLKRCMADYLLCIKFCDSQKPIHNHPVCSEVLPL